MPREDSSADDRIPSWDGNPRTFEEFRRKVDWWLEGEKLDVPYSLAARLARKLTGAAKLRAE
eukprot:8740974-Alexandrium_andersonii.AAC.1